MSQREEENMANNSTTTNVRIIPGRAANMATALRGHINVVLAYMRIGDADLTEEAIRSMCRDLTSFEREVRLNLEV